MTQSNLIHFIKENQKKHKITNMCNILSVPKSSYYNLITRKPSKRATENVFLKNRINQIYWLFKGIYGAPKIHRELKKESVDISLKRVQKLMKSMGLCSITIKKEKPAKKDKRSSKNLKNLLRQDFTTVTINEKWATDITYIHTKKDGWCYLCSIQDLFSKKIIGWSFSKNMTTDLVIATLNKTLAKQPIPKGLVIHSDQGSQYTTQRYSQELKKYRIKQSFSRKGCPYDNAVIESFHATLKKEEVYQKPIYYNFNQAYQAIFQYIEGFYNRKRSHSSINYLTPCEMELLALNYS